MVTYGDLMSLLLTFFILLLSFSSIQLAEFQDAMGSIQAALQGAFSALKSKESVIQHRKTPLPKISNFQRNQVVRMGREIQLFIQREHLESAIRLRITTKGIAIRISNPLLFELGKANLRPEILPFLTKVAKLAESWPNRVRIEGHTDNLPINTPQFPSNWELSTARALSVLKYFIETGALNPTKLSAAGYAEFRPIVPNDSPRNRAVNRRVEVFIEYEDSLVPQYYDPFSFGNDGQTGNLFP